MASLAQEPLSFEERGQLVEQIVDAAFDLFSGGLVAKWNRVIQSWYEGTMPRYAVRLSDYFSAKPYNHTTVQFRQSVIEYILTRVTLPPGITFDTLIDDDIPKDDNTGELLSTLELEGRPKVRLLDLVQRRFANRLDGKEYGMRGDDPARYKQPVQAPVAAPVVVDYYGETGFESVDQIEQELSVIYPPLLEPVQRLTDKDKEEIRRFRIALAERNNGAYEAGKIVLKDRQINDEQEEIDWINAHGGMSEEEYVLSLEKKDDKTDEDVAFLNTYCNENGYNDWEDAFETLKIEDSDDEDMSGAAVVARAEERKEELKQEKAELQRQAAMTEEVSILMDDYATRVRRTYIGAYAIDTAHRLNNMISGKLKKGERRANDQRIPLLQAKLRFAMAFYEGIDQIFKDNDTVPLVVNWPENNYRSDVVRYVVWGMNSDVDVDTLLFRPQAQRIQDRGVNVPLEKIAYTILKDRLGGDIDSGILNVTVAEEMAYKDMLLKFSPKREQKPPAEPGTIQRPSRGRSLERTLREDQSSGKSLRAKEPVKKRQRKKKQLKINTMPGVKTTKPHTPSPSPTGDDDKKVRARSRTPVRAGSSSQQTTRMLNKLSLKF